MIKALNKCSKKLGERINKISEKFKKAKKFLLVCCLNTLQKSFCWLKVLPHPVLQMGHKYALQRFHKWASLHGLYQKLKQEKSCCIDVLK